MSGYNSISTRVHSAFRTPWEGATRRHFSEKMVQKIPSRPPCLYGTVTKRGGGLWFKLAIWDCGAKGALPIYPCGWVVGGYKKYGLPSPTRALLGLELAFFAKKRAFVGVKKGIKWPKNGQNRPQYTKRWVDLHTSPPVQKRVIRVHYECAVAVPTIPQPGGLPGRIHQMHPQNARTYRSLGDPDGLG